MWNQGPFMSLMMVSSPTARPSMFAQTRTYGFEMSGRGLGQTPTEWYNRAKAAVAKFENLRSRIAQIAAKNERQRLELLLGSQAVKDSPIYSYNAVRSDLTDVEATTPLASGVRQYELRRRQNRITELEGHISDLEPQVKDAETTYGRLPGPTIVERERIVQAPDYTLPIVLGAGAVAAAIGLTLLLGGR